MTAEEVLDRARSILLIDYPTAEIPVGLAREGFDVVAHEGPSDRDYVAYVPADRQVERRPLDRPPTQVDVVYVHRPVEELEVIVASAKALGAFAVWCETDSPEARRIVEATDLAYVGDRPIYDLSPAARGRRMTEFFGPLVPGQMGCVFDHAEPTLVVGHIDVTPNLIAGTGFLFAPAVVALADTCAAIGCGENIPPGASFTTVELKSNFVSSARAGERVVCRCTPAHVGGRTHVWDAEVVNETTGRVMALFRCTQMVLHPRS